GWLPPRTPAAAAHGHLDDLIPPRRRVEMHVALIRHGRAVCRSGRPRCEACVLADVCPTAPEVLGAVAPSAASRSASAGTGRAPGESG
ncbi:MAG: hypothetical protein M3245_00365, partial [Actinomycetota bacterium]|nr:hypothetical protein [Actinomycetota bacterium]